MWRPRPIPALFEGVLFPGALLLLLGTSCATGPEVPAGVTVVEAPKPPPPQAAILAAQQRLKELGFFAGAATGDLTPAARVAIAQFQRSRELAVTGTLDEATAQALGLQALQSYELVEGPEVRASREERKIPGPSAATLLAQDVVTPLPQPPQGALEAQREQAAGLLRKAAVEARGLADEAAREGTPLLATEQAQDAAQSTLADARREGFQLLLEARKAGGFALLPEPLIGILEEALQRRALLLRGPDGMLGPDDEAAIRWVQRSLGMEQTGEPTLPLLEALGLDPSPMFAP